MCRNESCCCQKHFVLGSQTPSTPASDPFFSLLLRCLLSSLTFSLWVFIKALKICGTIVLLMQLRLSTHWWIIKLQDLCVKKEGGAKEYSHSKTSIVRFFSQEICWHLRIISYFWIIISIIIIMVVQECGKWQEKIKTKIKENFPKSLKG